MTPRTVSPNHQPVNPSNESINFRSAAVRDLMARLSGSEFKVWFAYASHANGEGLAWPSRETLARETGLHPDRVGRVRGSLIRKGCLVNGTGHRNDRQKNGTWAAPRLRVTVSTNCPHGQIDRTDKKPATVSTFCTSTVRTNCTQEEVPIEERPKEVKPKATAVVFELPQWVPKEAWDGWLEMRRLKGIKTTSRALKVALNRLGCLRDQGHDPGELLDEATLRNWKSIFAPKGDTPHGTKRRTATEDNLVAFTQFAGIKGGIN